MKYTLALFLLLFNIVQPCISDNSEYGLRFKSYEVLAADRTGLLLENGNYIDIKDELTLEFDLKYENTSILYGSTVKIISESKSSVTLGFSSGNSGNFPIMVINDEIIPILTDLKLNEWFHVAITISNKDQSLKIKYKDFSKTLTLKKGDWKEAIICFGKSNLTGFSTEEVPPMIIKDIKLSHGDKLFRHWILKQHNKTECYDDLKQAQATVMSPDWIIDSYANWTKHFSLSTNNKTYIQYAFDAGRGIIYFIPDNKQIISYNVITNQQDTIYVKSGRPANINTNHVVFNPKKNELISYNLEEKFISVFSFENKTWSSNRAPALEPSYWHHTSALWNSNSSIITFGGYGFYRYKNDLTVINPATNEWNTQQLNVISPRYSSASAIVGDTLYIYGGEGNQSGKQELTSIITADLYAIDLKTMKVSLCWEYNNSNHFLPCGNMIYNKEEDSFLVISKALGKQILLKVARKKPVIEELAYIDSLELNADYNFSTLMKPEKENKLYALFCKDYKRGNSEIDLYSIAYPPIASSQILQSAKTSESNESKTIYIAAAFAVICLVAGYTIYRRKRKKKEKSIHSAFSLTDDLTEDESLINNDEIYYDRSRQAISLLGFFNVKDSEGKDITDLFTPTLKSLVLAIILNSENGPGINSKVIDSLIWPDKDEKSARNNRNVSMNRLNQVLEKIGNVQVQNNNSFWKIAIEDNSICDYLEVLKYMRLPQKAIMEDTDSESKLLELLGYGQLLPFTQEEWLDSYKATYSDFAIDFLLGILLREINSGKANAILKASNLIFLFDTLNEEALFAKCRVYYKQGKKSLAKSTYNSFCKEYATLLGEKYQVSLAQIIGSN